MFVNEVEVKRYRSAKDYERDAKARARKGWMVTQTTEQRRNRSAAGTLAVGVLFFPALLIPRPTDLVVTYERRGGRR